MPRRFLTAQWRHLLMINFEIDPAAVPLPVLNGVEHDSWNGKHFVSLVGFLFLDTRVLGLGIPCHRDFEEVNLRYYVRRRAAEGWRRGVVFIREIAPRRAVGAVARWLFNEKYVTCPMSSEIRLPDAGTGDGGLVRYRWMSSTQTNAVAAEFDGVPDYPGCGSQEEFITEHYWGYSGQRDGSTLEYRVEHPRWRAWRAKSARLEGGAAEFYGPAYGRILSRPPSSAFIADGSEVAVYRGERIAMK
jgi:uncharacterized protein YqjF (DUF2071 family)